MNLQLLQFYLYQCVMAVKQAEVSLALPSVKGLVGCLSLRLVIQGAVHYEEEM